MAQASASDVDSTEVALETLADHFRPILGQNWTRQRGPNGLHNALRHAETAPGDSTERIFLSVGFKPWLVYFLSNPSRGGHFRGQSARSRAFRQLDRLPISARRQVARKLSESESCDSARRGIRSLEAKCSKPMSIPLPRTAAEPTCGTGERRATQSSPPSSRIHTPSPTPSELPSGGTSPLEPDPLQHGEHLPVASDATSQTCDPIRPSEKTQVLFYASPRAVSQLFPVHLGSAIQQLQHDKTWVANIQIVLPGNPQTPVNCCLQLAICSNKIEHLARDLFGVRVEVAKIGRCLVLSGGVTVVPAPELCLRGCRDDTLLGVFGPEVTEAIMASRYYEEERAHGCLLTECVTMYIPLDYDERAMLTVNLGLREGIYLSRKLELRDSTDNKDSLAGQDNLGQP